MGADCSTSGRLQVSPTEGAIVRRRVEHLSQAPVGPVDPPPGPPRPVGLPERGYRWCRRRPLVAGLLGLSALLTLALLVTVRAQGGRTVTTMLYFPGVALNAHDPFFDRRLLVRLRIVKHTFQARFDFVLGRA